MGCCEGQQILSFIDWLGLSLRLRDTPRDIPGHIWREYSATNVWGKRRVLYSDEGDRVLTLLTEPRSKVISSTAGLVEIDNEWFYHGGGVDHALGLLLQSVFFEVIGISRIDLCADFVPTAQQSDVIRGLAEKRYYVAGKRNGSGFWSTNTNDKLAPEWLRSACPHCQSWGHKTSSIKWKLYYKTKELLDDGGGKFMAKPYIIDQWRMADMDISNVWRLEVSLKHLNDYQVYGQRLDLDFFRFNRGSFFRSMVDTRFKIRAAEGHSDKTNDTEIEFLPMDKIGRLMTQAPTKRLAEHHGRITLLRHLVTSLEDEHVLLDAPSRREVLAMIGKVVQRDGLQNYFYAMTGMWMDDFVEYTENQAVGNANQDVTYAMHFPMAQRGSTDAERRLEVTVGDKSPSMPVNNKFEVYDGDGMVVPTSVGLDLRMDAPPRPTVQYTFPIKIRMPQYCQLGLKLP